MHGSFADAKVGSGITPEDRFYANRVDLVQRLATDHWSLWHLNVNAGVSTLGLSEPSPEQQALVDLRNATVVMEDKSKTLVVNSGSRELMILDIASVYANTSASQMFRVQFGLRFNEIIILAVDKDYSGPLPYFLGSTDLNPGGVATCSKVYTASMARAKSQCQRIAGHKGQHQFFNERGYGHFDTSGGMFTPRSVFGLPGYCQHCGYMVATNGQSEVTCFTCGHWLRILNEHGNKTRFIVNGRHYMPGAGGFYGRIFKVLRNDGTRWEGQLFTQGEIPEHLRHLLPDNAVVEEN